MSPGTCSRDRNYGFAVAVGTYRFEASQTNTVTLSTTGTNGKVIADSVGFVKIEDNVAPVAGNVQIAGSAQVGGTLTGSYTYSDANNDLQGASWFQWYRSDDVIFDAGDNAISGATGQSYVVQAADAGKYLFFEVTPVALTGITSGVPAQSGASAQIVSNDPPVATAVSVSGTPTLGAQLVGSYNYYDADGDPEGASIFRWYRSNDAVLDAGDTVVAGEVEVLPSAVKTSTSLNALRLANNLFNTNGMSPSGQELFNLDGSQPGEPTSADGISWVTPSGTETSLLAGRKVWFVADLGATHTLDQMRIWNFQWDHSTGDLSDRGISQFDLYVRDSVADTDDGTPGGTAINLDLSAATFNLGSTDPWQAALVNQPLGKAPNYDSYTGESFSLTGQTARFLALVADSYYGGNGIGLGKVRVQIGEGALNYTVVAEDVGKYLIFEVIPVAATGAPVGSAVWAVSGFGSNAPPVATNVTITGTPRVGQVLQGVYQYSDLEGDIEGGTTFVWYRSTDGNLDGGDTLVGAASSYPVQAADNGNTLFFQVTPRSVTGSPVGNPAASDGVQVSSPPSNLDRHHILIEENFSGAGGPLQGTAADFFDPAVTAAGGSNLWSAAPNWLDNGTVVFVSGVDSSAHLGLGSYINSTKGTPSGTFDLALTISETTGYWISLGFSAQSAPSTGLDFTGVGGIGTILYRDANNELDMVIGVGNSNPVDGPNDLVGARTLTARLDLTPDGGYNGTNNFGTVTWSDSALGVVGGPSALPNAGIGSLLLSAANDSSGTVNGLTLTQIAPPALLIAPNGGNLHFQWGSLTGKHYDLMATNDLTVPVAAWPPYNDGVTTYTNIPASGTGLNVLTNVARVAAVNFFVLVERP